MNALCRLRAGFGALLLFCGVVGAQLAVPPVARVSDQTATLGQTDIAALEGLLADLESSKGSQIAVLIVPTTAPESIEQYALRVAETWRLGRKGIDDGALLLVAKQDRALRIEVGYGLEGALPDATAQRIVSDVIVPRFREGDFAGGVRAGVERMIRVVDGEPLPPAARPNAARAQGGLEHYAPMLFVVALALGGVLRAVLGRLFGALATGGAVGLIAWMMVGLWSVAFFAGVMAVLLTLFGGVRGLGGAGLGGRGGGFGGGGGFSGGGGGFGGGGASGRW